MTSTIEISFYPLHRDYPASVLHFLKQLNATPGFEIQSNGMSTIIIGNFETLWTELGLLMAAQLSSEESIFVLKVAAGRREYSK
jgi:uncharacterized protein YqgV (UPF0045/DUF77 family)